MTRQHKQQRPIEVKFPSDAPDGSVRVVFATLNVQDHDGDVILPGFLPERKTVPMSAYGHASWMGALPVGKGDVFEESDQLVFEGQFFTNTEHGRDHYETVKGLGGLQEWSFGFDVLDGSPGEMDGNSVNFLRRGDVHEVSPVLLGAGIDTHTAAIKHIHIDDPDDILTKHGRPLQQHRKAVLEAATDLADRYKSLADADAEHGRSVSTARRTQMTEIADALEATAKAFRDILDEDAPSEDDPETEPDDDAFSDLADIDHDFIALRARMRTGEQLACH